jgi:hypothetical protein
MPKITEEDYLIIAKIAKRAAGKWPRPVINWSMDIESVHRQAPLRLKDLLNAEDDEFAHDLIGIYNNLDRVTGNLRGFFEPRFTDYDHESNRAAGAGLNESERTLMHNLKVR